MGTQSSRSQGLTPARASCIFQTSISDFDPLLAHSLDDLGPCQPSLVLIYSSGRKRMTEEVKQNSWHAVFAQFLSLPPPPAFSVSLKITWGFIFCGCHFSLLSDCVQPDNRILDVYGCLFIYSRGRETWRKRGKEKQVSLAGSLSKCWQCWGRTWGWGQQPGI